MASPPDQSASHEAVMVRTRRGAFSFMAGKWASLSAAKFEENGYSRGADL